MAQIKSYSNGSVGTAEIDDAAFGQRHNPVVLREAVLMYEANRRVGTHQTRTRRFVSGTSAKMYKQKHTGRARHGDRKAPGMRGGGVAHGPHPRDYSYSMPKKALKKALQVALASKIRDDELRFWSAPAMDKPSTKAVRGVLEALDAGRSTLIVGVGAVDKNLHLSVRNLPYVDTRSASEVTAYDVVAHNNLVLLDGALDALQARLGGAQDGAEATEGGDA